jgi:hypothetical protein
MTSLILFFANAPMRERIEERIIGKTSLDFYGTYLAVVRWRALNFEIQCDRNIEKSLFLF